MSAVRYTITTLACGQPAPYKDSRLHVRVAFEVDFGGGKGWQPSERLDEAWVREKLKKLECGFTDYTFDAKKDDSLAAWFKPRLRYLKQISPGVWEFEVTEAYTD